MESKSARPRVDRSNGRWVVDPGRSLWIVAPDEVAGAGEPRPRFETRRTPVGGLVMASRECECAGPARPHIVLVHGLVVSGRYLMPTAERLADEYNVHVPDLPGYGASESPPVAYDVAALANALLQWLDARGLARPTLLGNSFGCQILAEFAASHPERVD
jgi:2-hydroxy-6-oxonona-2,4-dienedioate hydrolase